MVFIGQAPGQARQVLDVCGADAPEGVQVSAGYGAGGGRRDDGCIRSSSSLCIQIAAEVWNEVKHVADVGVVEANPATQQPICGVGLVCCC